MTIVKHFTFEAAHRLPNVPHDHKCSRMHGHSYRVEVYVSGPLVQPQGWVIDFADIARAWDVVKERLDHHTLNEVHNLKNPTAENLAAWIFSHLKVDLPGLSKIVVWETPTAAAIYEGGER